MIIVLNPGHGGKYRSNVGPTGYVEADGVLDIGLRLKALLQAHSTATVHTTRDKDKTLELYERAALANKWSGDLYISLHTNAGAASAKGTEIYHTLRNEWGTKDAAEAKRVATIVQKHVVDKTGMVDRGIKTRTVTNKTSPVYGRDYYADIRLANMPTLLMETGFHSNREEESKLKTAAFRQLIAEGILEGLLEAYPSIKKPEKKEESGTLYRVQTGAFKHRENADRLADKLKKEGYDTYIVVANGLYKVQTGAFAKQENATALAKKIKAAGYDVYITTKSGQATATKPTPKPTIKVGSKVKIKAGAKDLNSKQTISSTARNRISIVSELKGTRAVVTYGGVVVAAVNVRDLILQ